MTFFQEQVAVLRLRDRGFLKIARASASPSGDAHGGAQ